jgi:hypothetical protein
VSIISSLSLYTVYIFTNFLYLDEISLKKRNFHENHTLFCAFAKNFKYCKNSTFFEASAHLLLSYRYFAKFLRKKSLAEKIPRPRKGYFREKSVKISYQTFFTVMALPLFYMLLTSFAFYVINSRNSQHFLLFVQSFISIFAKMPAPLFAKT